MTIGGESPGQPRRTQKRTRKLQFAQDGILCDRRVPAGPRIHPLPAQLTIESSLRALSNCEAASDDQIEPAEVTTRFIHAERAVERELQVVVVRRVIGLEISRKERVGRPVVCFERSL